MRGVRWARPLLICFHWGVPVSPRGVCVRAGHHCAKPLMTVLGVNATARASLYLYNDEADVDALADALVDAGDFFAF